MATASSVTSVTAMHSVPDEKKQNKQVARSPTVSQSHYTRTISYAVS